MSNKSHIKSAPLSLADLEEMDNEILHRIAEDLDNSKEVGMSHVSHSSSSGRGHSSHVSGMGVRKEEE